MTTSYTLRARILLPKSVYSQICHSHAIKIHVECRNVLRTSIYTAKRPKQNNTNSPHTALRTNSMCTASSPKLYGEYVSSLDKLLCFFCCCTENVWIIIFYELDERGVEAYAICGFLLLYGAKGYQGNDFLHPVSTSAQCTYSPRWCRIFMRAPQT